MAYNPTVWVDKETPVNAENLNKMEQGIAAAVLTVNGIAPDENGNVVVAGGSGSAGADGFSPIATVTQTADGALIEITDKAGKTTATITNGKDGVNGKDGAKGDKGDKGDTGATGSQGIQGEKGEKGDTGATGATGANGKDGVSATHSWNGTTLTITSASGTSSANLKGEKGDKGDKGDKGEQGSQGEKGEKGATGATGSKGADGYTPVKGVDYYTEADKAEFSTYIASELAKRGQLEPEFANSIEECTDTSKMYVLPDGFIYAYVQKETAGGIAYTNLVPTSTDTDGSVFNDTGYKNDVRLSSSGSISSSAQTWSVTTGFIPYKYTDIVRMKGAEWLGTDKGGMIYFNVYDASKKFLLALNADAYEGGIYTGASVVHDATTGVTTFDFSNGSSTADLYVTVKKAAYCRINASGEGADLIVTVNQEIKEAGSTISSTWDNTGRAFVPADYEDRIVEATNKATANATAISRLQQQVNGILDGSASIMASTKFDPTVYRLPILYLTGNTTGMTKENAVTLSYSYDGKSGSCTLKWQGSSSLAWDKKNYTIKFDNAFEAVEGWSSQSKYCLKANWIDHSHSRNVVSAKLWGLIRKNRSNLDSRLKALPNAGAIDGFPVIVMLNDEFHGLYSFNIPKDKWMFGMGSGTTEAIVTADNQATDTAFKGETLLDADGLELEYNSDAFSATAVKNSFNTLINACINSNGTDLDTTVAQYLDWESAIDYYIFTVIIKGVDMIQKNAVYATFDGVKWYFSAYDMDTTYGLAFDGSALDRAVSNVSFAEVAESHRVFELIKKYKTNELKARYNKLRANALSETRICQYFENYAWDISSPILLEDVKRWTSIRGSSVNGIDQICRWVRQRLEACDAWADAL